MSGRASNSNRLSCVLRIEAGQQVLILTGDAEATEELAMLNAGEVDAIDVLQVAHHGSKNASSDAFVAAAKPRWAIFPVGYRNPFSHPHPEVLSRFNQQGSQILRTDLDGAIHVEAGKNLKVTARRHEYPRYWYGR